MVGQDYQNKQHHVFQTLYKLRPNGNLSHHVSPEIIKNPFIYISTASYQIDD